MIKTGKHWVVHWIGVLALLCFTSGCNPDSIRVNSDPIGATVMLDGRNTGQTTPASLQIRDIPLGMHTITIVKEGYLPTTPPWDFNVKVHPGEILCSFLLAPICVPRNLVNNLWKEAEDVSGSDAHDNPLFFNMEKIEASTDSANQAEPKSTLNSSAAQRLNELNQLKKDGIISEEEYKSKRKAILDSL